MTSGGWGAVDVVCQEERGQSALGVLQNTTF